MNKNKISLIIFTVIYSLLCCAITPLLATGKVKVSVNGNAITDDDIKQRVAFLKLQHNKAKNLEKIAKAQLIEEKMELLEIVKRNLLPSEEEVLQKYKDFAQKNGMDVAQLSMMLVQQGLTPEHFKEFISVQIGWRNLIVMRYRAEHGSDGMLSSEETTHKQIINGGDKPTATEYKLQKIIFVVPDKASKSIIKARMRAINYFRHNFRSCEDSYELANKLLDVLVRDAGRILEPQLPTEWEKVIKPTKEGHVSAPIKTQEGFTAFAICEKRKVSDDRVAQLIYSLKESENNSAQIMKDLSNKYIDELKQTTRIVEM